MSRDFAQPRSLEDQITHRAKYMVDLIDRTTHPWSALLLAVHYVYSSTIGKAGYSPLIVLFSLEFSRLLAPGGDPYYFPCKLADTAVETLQQLWSGIYAPQTGNLTLDLCNSATVLVDLYAFGFLDDTRMMNCLNWLVSSAFESVEHLKCLEVLLERLLKVASSETGGRSLPFDFYDRTFYQDVISAWRISMTKNQEEDCKIKRFSAFAGFCDELTLPWNKVRGIVSPDLVPMKLILLRLRM
ncbi:hypothetical protein EST38_g7737 [Candolleomyces aberdarensis]|uniref:Uncharacterized protein n=1 Tax=Candolleomyces aberdarensis TaxID=2316362 RepID=A0A4Q2DEG0_9AGAR|nr:hypothetical protein EST38_g7737 [Candolleomyces aberdarensis]